MTETAHILVVEDEPVLLRGMTRALELLDGVRVTGCGTAEEAARVIRHDPPSLLITDINLPGRFGLSLIGDLAGAGLSIPVLVVTAYRAIYESQIPIHGNITVLEKPVSMETLHDVVRELLREPAGPHPTPFSLTDYLQVASLGRHSVRLHVMTASAREGIVDVEDGALRHVEMGDLLGMEALAKLLEAELQSITVGSAPAERPISELDIAVEKALLDLAVARDSEKSTTEDEAPEAGPDPFEAAFNEGVEASLAGEYERALEFFTRALELKPNDPRAQHNVARIRVILGLEDSRQS